MTDQRQKIFDEIAAERDYQVERWGNETDDTKNQPNDWIAFISHYSTRWFAGEFSPYSRGTGMAFRKAMVKVAATAIAAIESHDRQEAKSGKQFYER